MSDPFHYTVKLHFPGNLEYVSCIRKFISETLLINNFSQKFAYRSEVIVDELCTNAVSYGCRTADAQIKLLFEVFDDRIELQVTDQGGRKEDIARLQGVINNSDEKGISIPVAQTAPGGMGLEIVRMLTEEMELKVEDDNITTLRVVRKHKDGDKMHHGTN